MADLPSKISEALASELKKAGDDDVLELVVELRDGGDVPAGISRSARISAAKDNFEQASAAVEQAIRSSGGEVIERAWINSTLRVRLPVRSVRRLSASDAVVLVDLPRRIQRD